MAAAWRRLPRAAVAVAAVRNVCLQSGAARGGTVSSGVSSVAVSARCPSLTAPSRRFLFTTRRALAAEMINLPSLGDSISEGGIEKWVVAAGQWAEMDDVVVSIETDKTVVEIRAPKAGLVVETFGEEGDSVMVGDQLYSLDSDASRPDGAQAPSPASATAPAPVAPAAAPAAAPPAPTPPAPPSPLPAASSAGDQIPWRVPSVRFRHGNFVRSYLRHLQGDGLPAAAGAPALGATSAREDVMYHESIDTVPAHLRRRVEFTEETMELVQMGGAV